MITKFLKAYLIILLSVLLFSCESDETYDKKKAIDAFAQQDNLKIDQSISLYGINIPTEKVSDNWISSASIKNAQNQNIKKNFLSKTVIININIDESITMSLKT